MKITALRCLRNVALGISVALSVAAGARAEETYTVGLLTDMSGMLASAAGPGSVVAAEMAIEDYGKPLLGKKIDLISADHQMKPDLASSLARQWIYEKKVKVLMDIGSTHAALALRELVEANNVAMLYTSASSADLTNKLCSPNTVSWGHDSYQMSKVTVPVVEQGAKKWFLIVQDWAFGHSLEAEMTGFITKAGGEIVGSVRHPPGALDFASYLLQAQGSGADAIGLAGAVTDLDNIVKQASEFGIGADNGQVIVAPALLWSNVVGLGPEAAKGLLFSSVWYWNLNPEAAEWSQRFYKRAGFMPTEAHAAAYTALLHYFKAVETSGQSEGDKVIAQMKKIPVKDFYTDDETIRADGRLMRPAYLVKVKAPADVKMDFDFYEILKTIPAEDAFRPASESECSLMKAVAN